MDRDSVILITNSQVLTTWCLHELQEVFTVVSAPPQDYASVLAEHHEAAYMLLDYFCLQEPDVLALYCGVRFSRKLPVVMLLDDETYRSASVRRLFERAVCFNMVSSAHSLLRLLAGRRGYRLTYSFLRDCREDEGAPEAMHRFDEQIKMAAETDENILLLGESGSGKTWTASRIHELSARAGRTFFRVSAADLSPSLIESTLFGTTSGAYTGAVAQRGYFEAANGGTLFFDEIGELPGNMQCKLLDVLETHRFRRLGSAKEYAFDERFIFATNRDLEHCVREHTFRQDLFYRISSLTLYVPPLRQHPDDIPRLAAKIAGRRGKTLTPSALAKLRSYSWPGNIRELENVVTRSCVFSPQGVISAEDIRFSCCG